MSIRQSFYWLSSFVVVFAVSALAETEGRVQEVVICKSPGKSADAVGGGKSAGKSVRTLRVYETKEKTETGESADGCRATYSKTNVEQTVGTSRQIGQCQTILMGIQKNLEASKWSCRKAGSMAVLKSSAAETSEAAKPAAKPSGAAGGPDEVGTPSAQKTESVVR